MTENRSMLIDIEADQPEHVALRFLTSGPQGGDSGHGGHAELTFGVESGDFECTIEREDETRRLTGISFMARGDWEIESLERAIVKLAFEIVDRRLNLTPYGEDGILKET